MRPSWVTWLVVPCHGPCAREQPRSTGTEVPLAYLAGRGSVGGVFLEDALLAGYRAVQYMYGVVVALAQYSCVRLSLIHI